MNSKDSLYCAKWDKLTQADSVQKKAAPIFRPGPLLKAVI
jgi:hypothetical protein